MLSQADDSAVVAVVELKHAEQRVLALQLLVADVVGLLLSFVAGEGGEVKVFVGLVGNGLNGLVSRSFSSFVSR